MEPTSSGARSSLNSAKLFSFSHFPSPSLSHSLSDSSTNGMCEFILLRARDLLFLIMKLKARQKKFLNNNNFQQPLSYYSKSLLHGCLLTLCHIFLNTQLLTNHAHFNSSLIMLMILKLVLTTKWNSFRNPTALFTNSSCWS